MRENDPNYEKGLRGGRGLVSPVVLLSDSWPLLFNDPQSSGTTCDANIVILPASYINWP
jgi:hypothetical protein